MLNEMIMYMRTCPVCGRYESYCNDPTWWCSYCGPTLSQKAYKEIEKLTTRIEKLENSSQIIEIEKIENLTTRVEIIESILKWDNLEFDDIEYD